MIFVNALTCEDFEILMEKIELKPIGDNQYCVDSVSSSTEALWWKGIIVKHVQGDAAKLETLRPVIVDHTVDAAIVLGTQANQNLAGRHRDTRVMNIILMLLLMVMMGMMVMMIIMTMMATTTCWMTIVAVL